jgi:hypothetical protein
MSDDALCDLVIAALHAYDEVAMDGVSYSVELGDRGELAFTVMEQIRRRLRFPN